MAKKQSAPIDKISVDVAGLRGDFSYAFQFEVGGGISVVFGKSGSGKSTAVGTLTGLVEPTNGVIRVGDADFFDSVRNHSLKPRKRRVGTIFQDSNLFPHMSVKRNLTYAGWAGWRRSNLKFDDVVQLLGLEDLTKRMPHALSGGERQRVAIGRALLADPTLLVMDEPLASLDNARKQELLPYFKRLSKEAGIPIFYVTHSIDEVIALGDEMVLIEDGSVRACGSVNEVLPMVGAATLGEEQSPVSILEGVCSALDKEFRSTIINIGGMSLHLPGLAAAVGDKVRLRIPASNVILSLKQVDGLSVRNSCPAEVLRLEPSASGLINVHLLIGAQPIVAQVTPHAAAELGLKAGKKLYALIKSAMLRPI